MLFVLLAAPHSAVQAADAPVVRAVLFYSPDCSHCHEVMEKLLPPIKEKYGDKLDIAGVDVTKQAGQALYQSMANTFQLPDDRLGVPTLVVGDQVLVGEAEIPEQLPGLVEKGLAAGGIAWPAIPGLAEILGSQSAANGAANAGTGAPDMRLAESQPGVVHAVLFFSPDCTHCHEVMEQVLPPLKAKYGDKLDIAGVDVTHRVGADLYQAAVDALQVPDNRIGVPTLVIGSAVLVGSSEIPEQLPGLIEQGLAAGGIAWPKIFGLAQVLAAQGAAQGQMTTTSAASGTSNLAQDGGQPPFVTNFLKDPIANTIAVLVELLMLAAVVYVVIKFLQGRSSRLLNWPEKALLVMSLLGIGIAGYLSYSYVFQQEVVCGPVGNCHSVQSSEYAYLFGVLPVAVLGLAGYLGILAAWWVKNYGPENLRKPAILAMWAMAWFGTLFSLYLTFLEPFVIGASCAWCLTSAVLMTLVFLATSGPAILAMKVSDEDDYDDEDEDEDIIKAPGKA
jgi:uncharacterized membrane protein/thiol-disulfide isomerase/thioredoxin